VLNEDLAKSVAFTQEVINSIRLPDYMFAYLIKETISSVGKYIFKIKILGKGGNSKLIGPFSMEIV
jgi:hypothetical protein